MARCENCGQGGWENKDGHECNKCGFKKIANTLLDPGTLVYCDTCGNHYWNRCANGHLTTPVELNKPTIKS